MSENIYINKINIAGTAADTAQYSHSNHGTDFYRFPLLVRRLSGQSDCINTVIFSDKKEMIVAGARLKIYGQLRSYNNKSGQGSRLVITAFAKTIDYYDGEDENSVSLCGAICKPPVLRRTPLGRDICDIMLAINRPYGRADYIPCIAWGALAERINEKNVGEVLRLEGRLQSRKYTKLCGGESEEHTAFEVSVMNIADEDDN